MISSPPPPEAGLRGAVVGNTTLSSINGDEGKLIYRGLDIHDLARKSTFEEICYLLWFGALPTRAHLDELRAKLAQRRSLPKQLVTLLRDLPPTAAPIDVLRTAVSAMGLFDKHVNDTSRDASLEKAITLTATFPTILAAYHNLSRGEALVEPRRDLDTAANFLYMFFGKDPDRDAARVLDVALILHADHGMNASTFSAIVTAATLSDMYSAITSAVGTLKGPLHGGANEGVIKNLLEIQSPDGVEAWVQDRLSKHEKIMGFGHAVYKAYDPRATELKAIAKDAGQRAGNTKWVDLTERMEQAVWKQKQLYPNVDLYSASVYYTLGFPTEYFTPIFAVSRVAGWCAHVLEQYADNKLIRPRANYVGPRGIEYVPVQARTSDVVLPNAEPAAS
ncbi:MAG: citrate synthase [Candidatus Eremiobacteraeota bacterium]|nr:citrate synthase [Candidatus Eremiobacteraeota bacterium]MBV8222452.1 citrate synthase [Candidatus Eremiobacteraeota bacterium]